MMSSENENIVPFPKGDIGNPGLQSSGGGGNYDGMDGDVRVLQYRADQADKRMERVDSKLDRALEGIARIEGRINAMPTTWQMIALVFAILGASFAVIRFGLPAVGG